MKPWDGSVDLGAATLGTRRSFVLTALGALAVSAIPRPLLAGGCELTTDDVLGPYWVPNSPHRTVLASADEPGTRLFVTGRVFANNCASPVEGTIVDVWQATNAGCYSVVQACPDEDPYNLRGQMLTDAQGNYGYETILPGYYPGRCRHIHLRISPPQGPVLVTQLYFAGDPRIPNDPYASQPDAVNRIVPLQTDPQGRLHGVFDMDLAVQNSAGAEPEDFLPTAAVLFRNYPNPFSEQTTIRFQLPAAGPVELAVFRSDGRRVRVLMRETQGAGYHTVAWDGKTDAGGTCAAGWYLCRLMAGNVSLSQPMLLSR